MPDNIKPWWESTKFPSVGHSRFACWWVCQALEMLAAQGKGPKVRYSRRMGSLVVSLEELDKKFTALGGVLVSESKPHGSTMIGDLNWVWPNGAAQVDSDDGEDYVSVSFCTTDPEMVTKLNEVLTTSVQNRHSAGKVYVLTVGENGPELTSLGLASSKLEEGNYEPNVIADYKHVVADLLLPSGEEPCGRMILLNGEPGVGKTFMVRALLQDIPKAMFILTPSNLVSELAGPSFIKALLEARDGNPSGPTVLLIEDADECLVPREGGNVSAISALLNFTSGILGSSIDLRVVCTTNATVNDVDEAVLRAGRLCRRIEVGALSPEVAQAAYARLTKKEPEIEFIEPVSLAEVYRLARDSGWIPRSNEGAMGFNEAPSKQLRRIRWRGRNTGF